MDSIVIVTGGQDESGIGEWLRTRLLGAGYQVWVDKYDLPSGDIIALELEKAILECDQVLFVVNQATRDSRLAIFQVDLAMSAKVKITPIITDSTELPTRFTTRKPVVMEGTDDWQALHRLVNDLGGAAIPRVVNLSGHPELPAQAVLVLADIPVPFVSDAASLTHIAIDLGRRVIPYLTWETGLDVGIVSPGYAPVAVALFAYLASRVNQLPRLFWPHRVPTGQFQISGDASVDLQRHLRAAGVEDRLVASSTNAV